MMGRMIAMKTIRIHITALLIALTCLGISFVSWRAHNHYRIKAPSVSRRPIAVIDAGHGAFTDWGLLDYGATHYGIREADVTIQVTNRLCESLESNGWIAVTTRDGEFTPLNLIERSRLASHIGADVFVSIHTNSFRSPHPNGLSVHYWGDESEQLAQMMQAILCKRLGMKDRGIVKQPLTALVWASTPAVLVELGFISNPKEAQRLANETFQRKAANAIAEALTLWIRSKCNESQPCF